MASSGKKGKKSKGTVISLQSFLWKGDVPVGTTQVAKNIRNVDGEDSDEGRNVLTVVCQLPTAPRANRIFDDNFIPHQPPFIAYVTNLPFDVQEQDVYEYFNNSNIKSLKLPREDGDTGRIRGFCYVEFERRDDLIQSLSIRDPVIKGRRIRIDLSKDNDQNSRQRVSKKIYDSTGSSGEGRELSNWRLDTNTKRDSYNFNVERNFNEQKHVSDGYNSSGSWRIKNQGSCLVTFSSEELHQKDQDMCRMNKNNTIDRPKLMLQPRTIPLPEPNVALRTTLELKNDDSNPLKCTGILPEKVFGSAKPVDTTARDLEIEKRLADVRRTDKLRKEIIKTTNDLGKLNFSRDEKDRSINKNWRQQNENTQTSKNKDKKSLRSDTFHDYVKSDGFDDQKNNGIKGKDASKVDRQGENHVHIPFDGATAAIEYSKLYDESN